MPAEFHLKIGETDFSDLIDPLAIGTSSDKYPESIVPIPFDAPKATGDPYQAQKTAIISKSTGTQPSS